MASREVEFMRKITQRQIELFERYLTVEEKSGATREKYVRDVKLFVAWLGARAVDKECVVQYKEYLRDGYSLSSINSMLSSLNCFFDFCGWRDIKVKSLKAQRRIFISEEKELTKPEYERLLAAARSRKNQRLYLLMQTLCSTGIRISELRFITVEAVRNECAEISCKGKSRQVFLPKQLCRILDRYVKEKKIKSGAVFVTRNGNPLDRSNIWSEMKKLCDDAGVSEKKVFPHNLRHLFARTYYSLQKDIVRLADILGHSSVNTTRIYTMESGLTHKKHIQRLGLLMC